MVNTSTDSNVSLPALIPISTHNHLPNKLISTTFPPWCVHLCAFLNGFSLIGHIDGTTPQPAAATDPDVAARWFQQDQLLLAAILGSVSPDILPLLSSATTAAAAFTTLSRTFVSTSRAHVMFLKTSLTKATLGAKSIVEYVNHIKALADELGLIDAPIKDGDLTLYIINGLNSDYRELVSSVRTRETPFRFEELRDRLVEHEAYLKQLESSASTLVATANMAQSAPPHLVHPLIAVGVVLHLSLITAAQAVLLKGVVVVDLPDVPSSALVILQSRVKFVVKTTPLLIAAAYNNPQLTWLTPRLTPPLLSGL